MDIGKDLQRAFDDRYSKAIDEFVDFLSDYITENGYDCMKKIASRPYKTLMELAEQFKEAMKE